jgi:hypothetical protein
VRVKKIFCPVISKKNFITEKKFVPLPQIHLRSYSNAQQLSNIRKLKQPKIQKFGASPIAEF